jgi:heptaprenyl diphosphate synthase
METRRIAQIGVLVSLAMVLSYLESLFPVFLAVPGIRIGLANIAIVFALYHLGFRAALGISVVRVVLSALLFGSVISMSYSLCGALISLAMMAILKRSGLFGTVAVSVVGGVSHNLGQIAVACLILQTKAIAYYIPVLILSGVVSGVVIGIVSAVVIARLEGE